MNREILLFHDGSSCTQLKVDELIPHARRYFSEHASCDSCGSQIAFEGDAVMCRSCGEISDIRTPKEKLPHIRELLKSSRRRTREGALVGYFTLADARTILRLQNNGCYFCERKISLSACSIDHLIPLTMAGSSHWPRNLALTCKPCNTQKGNKSEEEFWSTLKGVKVLRIRRAQDHKHKESLDAKRIAAASIGPSYLQMRSRLRSKKERRLG